MKPVFLVGYMGSGKTTLGRALADNMKCEFIDLDIFIEAHYHATVKDLFATKGEVGFRKIEQNTLHSVGEFENVIVACGGGTPCQFDNMTFMNTHGITVYLNPSLQCLFNRLSIPQAKAKRPLIANKSDEELKKFIEESLSTRNMFYSQSLVDFDSSKLESKKQVADSVESLKSILKDLDK